MLEHVAARWANAPAVIGFELFNEPVGEEAAIDAFSAAAAARVRAVAPDKLVMFEPSATRNLLDAAPKPTRPFPVASAVYAPTSTRSCSTVTRPGSRTHTADLEPSVAAARDEATAWHTPLLIGEFGIGPTSADADLWMGAEAQLHDRYLASDAFWVWKEESQASWGVYDHDRRRRWTERPQVVAGSPVHAARIAGSGVTNEYDGVARSLHIETHGGGTHSVFVPDGYTVTCNGEPMSAGSGFVDIVCDGSLDVAP